MLSHICNCILFLVIPLPLPYPAAFLKGIARSNFSSYTVSDRGGVTLQIPGDAVVLNLTVPNPRLVPLRNTNIVIESAEHLGLPYAVEIGEIKPKHKVYTHAILNYHFKAESVVDRR